MHLFVLLLQHGDRESNPGPNNKQVNNISCYHWSVNSLLAQNLSTISQIEAYNSWFHDFICISETYSDATVLEGDKSFHLNSYNLHRADHQNNRKWDVCFYYNESISVCEVKLSNLWQCVLFVKSPCKTGNDILVLSTDPQAKTAQNLKIFYLTLMNFLVRLLQPSPYLL